jgi:ADP-ribose pyrophosphatase YjhB (NUDIX family)
MSTYKEETGFDIEIVSEPRVIEFIRETPPWHSITFVFVGKIISGYLQGEESKSN